MFVYDASSAPFQATLSGSGVGGGVYGMGHPEKEHQCEVNVLRKLLFTKW